MSYLKQYKYIAAIAESGGITLAADRLGIAQSSLSRYISKLEDELGAELFDRSMLPITLSSAGKLFLETGREMIALDRQLQRRIRDSRGLGCIDIRLGISPSRAPYILPAIISEFRKHNSSANLIICELTTTDIKRMLLRQELDLAISVVDDEMSGIECKRLFRERILLCLNPKTQVSSPIYPGKGQLLRDVMDKLALERPDIGTEDGGFCYIEAQNNETAVALVKAGLGFTVVPSYFEEFASDDGLTYRDIYGLPDNCERTVAIMYRKDQILKKDELLFIESAGRALG